MSDKSKQKDKDKDKDTKKECCHRKKRCKDCPEPVEAVTKAGQVKAQAPGPLTLAAIDIGSNAARLLIKEVRPGEALLCRRLFKVLLLRVPLRLGFEVFSTGQISKSKAEELRRLMKAYRQLMKIYHVAAYRACATSAMRDAANGPRIIRRLKRETGIDLEIIDGEQEARIVFDNHRESLSDREGNYVYVDVGGGSTEISFLSQGTLVQSLSYNIGTVRLLSGKVKPEAWASLKEDMANIASRFSDVDIIGSGGNIIKLYRLSPHKDKEAARLPVEALRELYDELRPLTPQERMEKYSLKADRADVIVPAAEIFLTVADAVGAKYVQVPAVGLADGLIDELYHNICASEPE